MTLADFPEIQALSAREKLELVDQLWVAVAPELDKLETSSEEQQILDDRWERFLKDPNTALTLEQFQERLRALRA
jgi:putative addiction module component (TIGR02574 family)